MSDDKIGIEGDRQQKTANKWFILQNKWLNNMI